MTALVLALIAASAAADDDDWDDIGFGDPPAPTVSEAPAPHPWQAGGRFRSEQAVWLQRLDTQPLAQARQSLDLFATWEHGEWRARAAGHAEVDPVALRDPDPATRRTFGWWVAPREVWVARTLGPLEITAGRQVVPWGEGLLLSPVDVVNPRDLREPGLVDLADLRLPATVVRIDLFAGPHRLQAMWMPETAFHRVNPPYGPFSIVPGLLDEAGPRARTVFGDKGLAWTDAPGRFDLAEPQLFVRWAVTGRGVDASLYAATLLDRGGVLVLPPPEALASPTLDIVVDHRRTTLLGHSGSATSGDVVLRWEASVELSRAVDTGNPLAVPAEHAVATTTLLQGMVGATWTGLAHTTVVVELSQGMFPSRPKDTLMPLDATTAALMVQHDAVGERLQLTASGAVLGVDARHGGFLRADASWELTQGLRAGLGVIAYRPGRVRGPWIGLDHHDRLFTRLDWTF